MKKLIASLFLVLLAISPTMGAESPELVRERIEWCDIWFTDAEKTEHPRVLMIGDSITRGYFGDVEKRIGDAAYCGRYTTSRSVCDPVFFDELRLVLRQYEFAVIHFNNGLHGWGYTEEAYEKGFAQLLDTLQAEAPKARLIWAATTPVMKASGMGDHQVRVPARNGIAARLIETRGISTDDLYTLSEGKEDHFSGDGVHLSDAGRREQAEQVSRVILEALK